MEREARLAGKVRLADWNVVPVLNKTPCCKGSWAAGGCCRLAVYGSPLNTWRDAGQERIGLWVGKTREGELFGGSPRFLVCPSCHFLHLCSSLLCCKQW